MLAWSREGEMPLCATSGTARGAGAGREPGVSEARAAIGASVLLGPWGWFVPSLQRVQ